MRYSLDHLPETKRGELAHVVAALRDGFARAMAERKDADGRLLKIILFGSYARGDWVDDPVGRYFSDYDLLVVVDREDLTDVPEIWAAAEERLLNELAEGKVLRTPVSPIYHTLDDVNAQLREGRYFFVGIIEDGIQLFSERDVPFVKPEMLSPREALELTKEYFEDWSESADGFLRNAGYAIRDDDRKLAAFLLHQATERFYHCALLVRTLYSTKTHNLNRLRSLAESMEPGLHGIWPHETKFEKRCYELLRAAYVKARYSKQYRITADELAWLKVRIKLLRDRVRDACLERIAELEAAS